MKKIFLPLLFIALFITNITAGTAFAQTTTTTATPTITSTSTPTTTSTNKLLKAAQNSANQQTRMQTIISKADGYISARIASINTLIAKINASKEASSTQGQADISALNADITGLTGLKAQIDAFNTPTTIKTVLLPLVQQIFTTYRVYAIEIPKDHLELHSAVLYTLNTNYTTAQQNLTQDITFAQGQGKNVGTIQVDDTKYSGDVAKFNADLQAAQTALNAIVPSNYQKGVSAFTTVKADFSAIHTDSQNIHTDFAQFTKDFKTLFNL